MATVTTALVFAGCDNIAPSNALEMFNAERSQREHERQLREQRLVLKLKSGLIVIRMLPDLARAEVEHVRKLTQDGVYDGTRFHRVVRTPRPFILQAGDPLTRGAPGKDFVYASDQPSTDTTRPLAGTGGAEFPLTTPTNNLPHAAATVALASRDGELAGAQFFIALDRLPFLDGTASVFGIVESGWDCVQEVQLGDVIIEAAMVEPGDIDLEDIGAAPPELPKPYQETPRRGR